MGDLLGMSDEDFLNKGESLMGSDDLPPEELGTGDEPVENLEPVEGEEVLENVIPSGSEEEFVEGAPELVAEPVEGEEPQGEEVVEESENSPEIAAEEPVEGGDLQKVLQPFRANGKDMSVKNVDEAITLMQLGANYTKKMQELSPNLKLLKSLEKNELLDEGKLNYLIDLSKNDPAAIAHLLKESKYEAVDNGFGEVNDDVEYSPTNHQVSDTAMQLDEVLSSLENTPTYDKCIDLIGNQWDAKSKQLLTQDPSQIRALNEQMQAGIFDKVNAEVERVKMFGGLSGQSDFEAYRTVGAQMMQAGLLTPTKAEPIAKTEVKPLDKALSQKRKAATASRSVAKTVQAPKKSVLAMSDEEFLKINNIQL